MALRITQDVAVVPPPSFPFTVSENAFFSDEDRGCRKGIIQMCPAAATVGQISAIGDQKIGGGGSTCHDCGNQAKKDCGYRRCRTCCKSRGFECSTHVKSTWVPAAKRRERQVPAELIAGKSPKQPRSNVLAVSHTSTSSDVSSTQQDLSFRSGLPVQVKTHAVFRCVKVRPVDGEGKHEFAYQSVVNIGGHIFKGVLYDQGVDESGDGLSNLPELHINGRNLNNSSTLLDHADVYGPAAAGLLGGTS